jgi:hypothetical protein
MDSTDTTCSFDLLSKRHEGILIPLSAAAREIGVSLRTAHNQISKGIFPIPTILRDRRRYVHLQELAGYLDELRLPPPKRRATVASPR